MSKWRRLRVWPEAEELEPATKRGEIRLVAEVMLERMRGRPVPPEAHRRAMDTIRMLAR